MRKIYLLALSVVFTASSFAQTQLKKTELKSLQSLKATKNTVSEPKNAKIIGGNSTMTVTGSLTSDNGYIAGTVMDLTFTLDLTNTDDEWVDYLQLTFPTGLTPTVGSTPSTVNGEAATISGQVVYWGVDDDSQFGAIASPATYSISVNVTVASGLTGNKTVTFLASGDTYQATTGAPVGDLNGSAIVTAAAATDLAVIDKFLLRNGGSNCEVVAGDTLILFVKNVGASAVAAGQPIYYSVNGGTVVNESAVFINTAFTATLASLPSGDTAYVLFTTPLDFSGTGVYQIIGGINATGDAVTTNNQDTIQISHLAPIALSPGASFTEGFEAGVEGWAVQDIDGGGYSWNYADIGNAGSAISMRAGEAAAGASDDWLFTSCMDFVAGDVYNVSYYQRLSSGSAGSLGVFYGTAQDASTMTNTIVATTALTANGTYSQGTGSFTASTTGTYYIGFRAVNTNATTTTFLRVDDINITNMGNPLAVKNISAKNLSVYPNPSNGQFTIDMPNASNVTVYNVLGSVVYNTKLNAGVSNISLNNLNEGVYFVKATVNGESVVKQVVIAK